jgi:transcription elongation factor SPT6
MKVGADINLMATNAWQSPPLEFVAGLGPRKARALLEAVQREGHVESRHQLWKDLGVLGNRVFRNCAPFLRVRSSGAGMSNVRLDVLDDSRIHPESYHLALEIARSALNDPGTFGRGTT